MINDIGEEFLDETISEGIVSNSQYCHQCGNYIQEACLYLPFGKKRHIDPRRPIFTYEFIDEMQKFNYGGGEFIHNVEDGKRLIKEGIRPTCWRCREKKQ